MQFGFRYFATIGTALLLAACGGGGDGGASESAPAPVPAQSAFPVNAAALNIATRATTFNAAGQDSSGNTYTIQISISPGQVGYAKFGSFTATDSHKTFVRSATLKKNGVLAATSVTTTFYEDDPRGFGIFYESSGGADLTVTSTITGLPSTALVGQSGPMYTGTYYPFSSGIDRRSIAATWSLEADTASTAWLCWNKNRAGGSTSSASVTSDCIRISANGEPLGYRGTVMISSGVTLTLK